MVAGPSERKGRAAVVAFWGLKVLLDFVADVLLAVARAGPFAVPDDALALCPEDVRPVRNERLALLDIAADGLEEGADAPEVLRMQRELVVARAFTSSLEKRRSMAA